MRTGRKTHKKVNISIFTTFRCETAKNVNLHRPNMYFLFEFPRNEIRKLLCGSSIESIHLRFCFTKSKKRVKPVYNSSDRRTKAVPRRVLRAGTAQILVKWEQGHVQILVFLQRNFELHPTKKGKGTTCHTAKWMAYGHAFFRWRVIFPSHFVNRPNDCYNNFKKLLDQNTAKKTVTKGNETKSGGYWKNTTHFCWDKGMFFGVVGSQTTPARPSGSRSMGRDPKFGREEHPDGSQIFYQNHLNFYFRRTLIH
jgi:hypothetical protein